jgi:ketopantoate reductase
VEALKATGLHIQMADGDVKVPIRRALHLCDLASANLEFDIVFLAVKSYDHRWLAEFIKPYLKSDGVLVGVMNGMNDDSIASIVGRNRTVGCCIELSAEIFTPGLVQRNTTHQGTWFAVGELDGLYTPRVKEIQDILSHVARCEVSGNIYGTKWTKLVANTMTMGPHGLLGLRNGEAVAIPGMADIAMGIGRESLAVGTALGYRIEPIFGLRADEFAGTSDENLATTGKNNCRQPAKIVDVDQALATLDRAKIPPKVQKQLASVISKLARIYDNQDCTLAEINPLVVTPSEEVWALDAKVVIDDNALDRHADLADMRDLGAEDPGEVEAREKGLSYVRLDGTIGCVVNGAGLAMATMDLIQFHGGKPANFLDIGGSSNPDKVTSAMNILTRDQRVRAVLFNIFGGITRCDDVARGLLAALDRIGTKLPIVIRLTGTNEREAREMLSARGMVALSDMDEAVRAVIARAAEAA